MIYKLLTEDYYSTVNSIPTVTKEDVFIWLDSKINCDVCIDIETCFSYEKDRVYKITKSSLSTLNCFDNKILLIQFGNLEEQFIIDIRSENKLFLVEVCEKLSKCNIVGQNLIYDLHWLKYHFNFNIIYKDENIYDTMIVEKLLHMGKYSEYNLKAIYQRYFNINIDYPQLNFFEPFAPKKTRESFVGITTQSLSLEHLTYSRYDIIIPLRIKQIQTSLSRYKEIPNLLKLEMETLLVLVIMKLEGINLDLEKWNSVLDISNAALIEIYEQLKLLGEINWNSYKQKLEYFENLEISMLDKHGQKSVGIKNLQEVLKTLNEESEGATTMNLLINYGKISKQVNAYGNKFLRFINSTTNKIHTDINQIVNSGRTSSSNPNGQNIPATDEYRNAFYLEEGLSICDYSGMETRRVAEIAEEQYLINALNSGLDPHLETAYTMFGKDYMDTLKEEDSKKFAFYRKVAKTLNFSIIYGISAYNLSSQFNVSIKVAEKWIKDWFSSNKKIKKWLDLVRKETLNTGCINIDSLGRKYYHPEYEYYINLKDFLEKTTNSGTLYLLPSTTSKRLKKDFAAIKGSMERKAGNYPVQGSCATIMKIALVLLVKRNIIPVLQVHDEILVKGNFTDELITCMNEAWKFLNKKVDMPLTASYSPFWVK